MELTIYDSMSEFADDLVKNSVLDEKDVNVFIDEAKKEMVNVCFFDDVDGKFTCYIWINEISVTKENDVLYATIDAFAFYCGIHDKKVLAYMSTGCLLTNYILKSFKKFK